MTVDELKETFEKFNDEYLKFERVGNPKSRRPDLCAFLMLDEAMQGKRDIVSAAEHDEIYLDFEPERLAAIATEDMVRDLLRCGVLYSRDGLSMFT